MARRASRGSVGIAKASLLEEVESCSTSVLSSRAGANRDGRNYVTGASQSVGRRRESPSTAAAPTGIPRGRARPGGSTVREQG